MTQKNNFQLGLKFKFFVFALIVIIIFGLVKFNSDISKARHGKIGSGVTNIDSLYGVSDRLEIGTAVRAENFDDPNYTKILNKNFNLITPEYEMKWAFIEPKQGEYDFSKTDKIVNFAVENDKAIHGHTLIWHTNIPNWVEKYIESLPSNQRSEALSNILKDYITTIVTRYKGKIATWDVINEVLAQKDAEAVSSDNPFRAASILQKYLPDSNGNGIPDYIELAFKFAHDADPKAKLYYNEYNIEYLKKDVLALKDDPSWFPIKNKSENAFKLVSDLLKAGVPIDGIGIQGHFTQLGSLNSGLLQFETLPNYPLYKTLKMYQEIGVESRISEMDVIVHATPPNTPSEKDLENQAITYSNYLFACSLVENCKSFTVWQFSDNSVWYGSDYAGTKAEYYPNLFTRDWKPKQAYHAVAEMLNILSKSNQNVK